MFKKILTAIDPVDLDNNVFDKALLLAHAMHTQLKFVSVLVADVDSAFAVPEYGVVPTSYGLNDWNLFEESYQAYRNENIKTLSHLSDRSKQSGISANFEQVVGSPGTAICKLAKNWKADLIVVGSHQRRGLSEMLVGSISNYALHHAPCSVLIVR